MKKSDKPSNKQPSQGGDKVMQHKRMAMGDAIPNGKPGGGKKIKP